jgi:hypothetical protein
MMYYARMRVQDFCEVSSKHNRCFAQTQKREHVHAKIAQLGRRSPHLAIGKLRAVYECTKVVHE